MFKYLSVITALFATVVLATSANAVPCGPRDALVEKLQSKYSETLSSGGLQGKNALQTIVEVWSSEKTGTFTVIVTTPKGMSCILAAGTEYFTQDATTEPEGVDG